MKYLASLLFLLASVFMTQARVTYQGSIETGGIILKESSYYTFPLETVQGVNINRWLYTGVGGGMWMIWQGDGGAAVFPIYGDVRFTYPSRWCRPFVDLRLGALLNSEAFVANPSIGVKFAWRKKAGVYLSVGVIALAGEYNKGYQGVTLKLGFDF